MAVPLPLPEITHEQIIKIADAAYEGLNNVEICKRLGFQDKYMLPKLKKANPVLKEYLDSAREMWCEDMESRIPRLLEFHSDWKKANCEFEYLKYTLAVRMPQRYSQRIDINVNQNVSIQANIGEANNRLGLVMRDVLDVSTKQDDKPIQLNTTTQSK